MTLFFTVDFKAIFYIQAALFFIYLTIQMYLECRFRSQYVMCYKNKTLQTILTNVFMN